MKLIKRFIFYNKRSIKLIKVENLINLVNVLIK